MQPGTCHPIIAESLGGYETARIIHFTTPVKPWASDCDHPQREVYLRYRSMTPWRGARLETAADRARMKTLGKRKKQAQRIWRWLTRQPKPAPPRPHETRLSPPARGPA